MSNQSGRRQTLAVMSGAVLLAISWSGASAQEWSERPVGLWGSFGLGYGSVRTASTLIRDTGGGVWLDMQVGARIGQHWLVGFELGGLGLQISQSNHDPNDAYSSIYGQGITNEFLVVQYAPRSDRGWFAGAGWGRLMYDNKSLESVTFNARSGNGSGGIFRVGYDWKLSRRGHIGLDVSYETGNVALNYPLSGGFHFSVIAAGLHAAYH